MYPLNWKKIQNRQRLSFVGWGVALFGTAILLPSEQTFAQNPPTIEQMLGIQDLTRGELPAPRFPDPKPTTQGRTQLATPRVTNSEAINSGVANLAHANAEQVNSVSGPTGSTTHPTPALWDYNDAPPYSDALSELLQGSQFHPNRQPSRSPAVSTAATGMTRSTGYAEPSELSSHSQLGWSRNPLRSPGASSARATTSPPAGNLSIPRPVPQTDNVRPLVISNQRSQSLLHDSRSMGQANALDNGTIGLIAHHSDVDLDLPPPYEVADTNSRGTAEENSSARRHDRPLSQVITSPNLPLQSGFHPDDFDEVANQDADRNNRLSDEKFERLRHQFSAGGGDIDKSEVAPASFDLNETRPIINDTSGANARRSIQNDLRSHRAPRKLDPPLAMQAAESNQPFDESKPPVKLGARALPNDPIQRSFDRTREFRPAPLTQIPGTETKLLDFPGYRSHLLHTPADASDTVMTRLAEANYWNQRGGYEQAAGLLNELQPESLDDSQRWELAFQTVQAAVGLRHPMLFRQAFETAQDLWPNQLQQETPSQLELIYHDYFAAYNGLLQPEPNYVAAADSFQSALRRIADRISTAPAWSQQRMIWIMVDSHCRLAQCVAFGPYRQGAASADQWFEEADRYVEKLIDSGRADSLLRLIVVQRQIECYAQTGRFREIPPLLNYMKTWEHQLFANNQREESRWVHQLVTENLLQSGLHALNHQQWTAANAWANQAVSRLEVRRNQRDWQPIERHYLATAYWLQGAVHFQTGNGKASQPLFDAAVAIWSNPTDQTVRDPLGHGERLAIMAVAYWQREREQVAVTLGQEAVTSIQEAIDRGTATADRLDIPAANLHEMLASSPTNHGDFAAAESQTVSYQELDLNLELEADHDPPNQDHNLPLQEALEDPRTEAPIESVIPR